MDSKQEYQKIKLTVLTPVHIGSGESYTPLNSSIKSNIYRQGEYNLKMFSEEKISQLFAREPNRKKFNKLFESDEPDLGAIYRFFRGEFHQLIDADLVDVLISKDLGEFYENKMKIDGGRACHGDKKKQTQNNLLEIARFFYNPTNQNIIIPGSSIKGSLRTALLNGVNLPKYKHTFDKCIQQDTRWYEKKESIKSMHENLNQTVLEYDGKVINDPLKYLSVSDTQGISNRKELCEILLKKMISKRQKKEKKNLEILLECICPGKTLQADLIFRKQIQPSGSKSNSYGKMNFEFLKKRCDAFYPEIFQRELRILQEKEIPWSTGEECEAIQERMEKNEKGFLLRLGLHSGAESMTVENYRKIAIKMPEQSPNKFEYRDSSTTIWVSSKSSNSNEAVPFGWVWVEASN